MIQLYNSYLLEIQLSDRYTRKLTTMNPQTDHDNIRRLWTVKDIVDEAVIKCQAVCQDNPTVSKTFVLDLMHLLADASSKASNMRWTDDDGMSFGTAFYIQAIKNL
jgi:hypothetical protein